MELGNIIKKIFFYQRGKYLFKLQSWIYSIWCFIKFKWNRTYF